MLVITHWKLKVNKLQVGHVLIKHDFKPQNNYYEHSRVASVMSHFVCVTGSQSKTEESMQSLEISKSEASTARRCWLWPFRRLVNFFLRGCNYHAKIAYSLHHPILPEAMIAVRPFKDVTKSFISCVVLGNHEQAVGSLAGSLFGAFDKVYYLHFQLCDLCFWCFLGLSSLSHMYTSDWRKIKNWRKKTGAIEWAKCL